MGRGNDKKTVKKIQINRDIQNLTEPIDVFEAVKNNK